MTEHGPTGIGRRQFVQAGAVTGAALLGGGSGDGGRSDGPGDSHRHERRGRRQAPRPPAQRHLRLRAGHLHEPALDRAGRAAGALRQRPAARLGALFPGDADGAGPAPSHPERPALPLLSRRSARGVHAPQRRDGRARRRRSRSPERAEGAAPHPRQHLPHRTAARRGHWFLGGSTEWPGVVPAEDVEIGDLDALAAKYPSAAADMRAIAASVRDVVPPGGPR